MNDCLLDVSNTSVRVNHYGLYVNTLTVFECNHKLHCVPKMSLLYLAITINISNK